MPVAVAFRCYLGKAVVSVNKVFIISFHYIVIVAEASAERLCEPFSVVIEVDTGRLGVFITLGIIHRNTAFQTFVIIFFKNDINHRAGSFILCRRSSDNLNFHQVICSNGF